MQSVLKPRIPLWTAPARLAVVAALGIESFLVATRTAPSRYMTDLVDHERAGCLTWLADRTRQESTTGSVLGPLTGDHFTPSGWPAQCSTRSAAACCRHPRAGVRLLDTLYRVGGLVAAVRDASP